MIYFIGLVITFILFSIVLELNKSKIPSNSIHGLYAGVVLASLIWVIALPLGILIGILYLINLGIKKIISKYKG